MKHLKRIFEDKNFREINETILDELLFTLITKQGFLF